MWGRIKPGFFSRTRSPPSVLSQVLALRTREYQNQISSYIVAFDVLSGDIVVPEIKISDHKLEGLEFA